MPSSDCADAQADLGLGCPHMPKDTAHIALTFSDKNISTQRQQIFLWACLFMEFTRQKSK